MDDEALNNLCSIHQEMSEAHGVMAAFYEKDDGGEMAAALETDDLEKMFFRRSGCHGVRARKESRAGF